MASAAVTQAAGTGQVTALPVRPTVFIGLGGTGMEVLLRLRRRILAERWNGQQLKSIGDFPIAAFLYFDTDQRATAQSDIKSDEDPFLSLISLDGEAIRPKDFRPGKFQSNIDNYPTLRDWLPTQSLSGVDTSQGAGQIRAISRLLFFDQVKNFDAEVRKRANMVTANLSNQRSLTELGLAPDKNLRAVVVAGLGGGTGAGSFIDVGLFLRQVSGPEFGEVDAYLMLPSGFAKHGTRTLANGFAALTELEHAMRKQSPPYATRWGVGSEAFKPSLDANRQRPFSDVYLFDVANIAGNRSEHVEPIYEMMADSLFEDFGTSGFADRKRSARVNRIGAKDRGFRPDAIDGDTSVRGFAFSTAYSALGQSRLTTRGTLAIDEAAEVAVQDMLKSFFGVALPGDRRTAQAPDRDRFLNEALRLAPCVYDDFPKHLKPRPAAVSARQLVDTILGAAGRPLDAQLVDDIHRAFDAMRAALASPGDWVAQARELHRQYKAEVLPQAGVEAIREKKVGEARTALARLWFSNDTRRGSGSLLDALFERVDDRERGGVDFTIGLIEDVRAALERPDGPIGRLTSAAEDLEAVAETLHERQFDMALDSIEKSLKGGMFGRADIVSAESYLKSAGECLADGLAFRLRARAAREGAALLRDAIEKLGRQTADSEGRTKYSGLLGKLHDYRAAVEGLIGDAGREQRKIANRVGLDSSGTALVVEDGSEKTPFAKVDLEAATWADESFRSLGQCRALLPKLEKGDENFNILNTLRNSARAKLDVLREDMPTISDALAALPEGQADRLLEQLMSRAMPWIEPAPDSDFKPDSDQSVSNAARDRRPREFCGTISGAIDQSGADRSATPARGDGQSQRTNLLLRAFGVSARLAGRDARRVETGVPTKSPGREQQSLSRSRPPRPDAFRHAAGADWRRGAPVKIRSGAAAARHDAGCRPTSRQRRVADQHRRWSPAVVVGDRHRGGNPPPQHRSHAAGQTRNASGGEGGRPGAGGADGIDQPR